MELIRFRLDPLDFRGRDVVCSLLHHTVENLGDGNGFRARHAVCCLQVSQSEYINDYGAISCPFKLLSPVLSNQSDCVGGGMG